MVDGDLASLLDMVETLNRILPQVQFEIDRQYYYCYGDGAVTQEQSGGVLVYVVRGESFATYIQNAYGQSVVPVQGGVRAQNYMFYPVSIFDPIWTGTFGYPFVIGDFSTADNTLGRDFGCLNPSAMQSGQGTIVQISGAVLHLNDNGQDIKLNLGACTRIETATRVPQVGQTAIFKGVPSLAGGYNVYAMTCY